MLCWFFVFYLIIIIFFLAMLIGVTLRQTDIQTDISKYWLSQGLSENLHFYRTWPVIVTISDMGHGDKLEWTQVIIISIYFYKLIEYNIRIISTHVSWFVVYLIFLSHVSFPHYIVNFISADISHLIISAYSLCYFLWECYVIFPFYNTTDIFSGEICQLSMNVSKFLTSLNYTMKIYSLSFLI